MRRLFIAASMLLLVVACSGTKHTGYHVSMIFTNMSRQAQTRLTRMSDSPLG